MRYVFVVLILMFTAGCADMPTYDYARGGAAFSNMAQTLQGPPVYQAPQQQNTRCQTSPDGYGGYRTQCYPY